MRISAKIFNLYATLGVLFMASSCTTCNLNPGPGTNFFQTDGFYNGMVYRVLYEDSFRRDLALKVDSVVWEFAASLSDVDPKSILSRVNAHDSTVVLSELFIRALRNIQRIDSFTGGYLKVNTLALKKRWGLDGKKLKIGWKEPLQTEIDSFLQCLHRQPVSIISKEMENTTAGQAKRNAQEQYWLENFALSKHEGLDLSPVFRGLLTDLIAEFLELEGIDCYSVQVDQVIRTKGMRKNKRWKAGIERPQADGQIIYSHLLQFTDSAIATNGFTRKAISTPIGDFLPMVHPQTGRPVPMKFESFTVVSEDATTADLLSWAFTIMGSDSAFSFSKKHLLEFYYSKNQGEEPPKTLSTLNKGRLVEGDTLMITPSY